MTDRTKDTHTATPLDDEALDGAAGGIKLTDVIISSYQVGGSSGGDRSPMRKASLTSMTEGESDGV